MNPWGLALLVWALAFAAFALWWGGRGRPLTTAEADALLAQLAAHAVREEDRQMLVHLREWAARDDGREFVMHNAVRYRRHAEYPVHLQHLGTDPRAADRRYARRIIGPLLRHGSCMLFVARRQARFIEPVGLPDWHYVAMVRYRSLRDFLRFACAIERDDIVVHKWAAIETTQVFPTRPMLSLLGLRLGVGVGLGVLVAGVTPLLA